MNKNSIKSKTQKIVDIFRAILSSKYFSFITAAVTLLCYYLGWDVVLFYYIAIVGIMILLLLEDATPFISLLLFMSISISLINTPSNTMGDSDYYHRPEIYIQIFTIIGLLVSVVIYRLIKNIVFKRFKITPIFFGMCGFAIILMLNGIFTSGYNPKNLLYGFILASCILGIYSSLKDNLKLDSEGFERIAYSFLAFSTVLLIELIVAYATTDNLFEDGTINRYNLIFGWGVYNTFGVMLTMCIPGTLYLAGRKKFGFAYTLYSFVLFIALFFSCSRQAMIGGPIIYLICIVILFVKGKNKFANACILTAGAVAGIIFLLAYHETVFRFFKIVFENLMVDGELDGSGRTQLWREATAYFKQYPVFGSGFFVHFSYNGNSGLGFMPLMCHNTILELLSACGIVGIIVYLAHRTQTVISFCKNITLERTFIALTILSILLLSLLDNHLFNIFPTIIYSSLIAILDKSEEKIKTT